jgi:5S rRNA maturation endonuclease (ribonuclease M5)
MTAALDERQTFRPARDLPRRRPEASPSVTLYHDDGTSTRATFDPANGQRRLTGREVGGPLVRCEVAAVPRDLLRAVADRLGLDDEEARDRLAASLRDSLREVLLEVDEVRVDARLTVHVVDDLGTPMSLPHVRALVAMGLVRHLHERGIPPAALVLESPDAFLHPAAQEQLATVLVELSRTTQVPVLVTTTSPFVIPRTAGTRVVALSRDAVGRTHLVHEAGGDEPQARQLGGLLGDSGLASVLDRVAQVPGDARGVLIVEGGTDEAYLRIAARVLGREEVLDDLVIQVSGGAMAAALDAIVLRAERTVPLLVLLDHDDAGRRARDTLVGRFEFDRRTQVTTYAEVVHGQPVGVEAETLFDAELMRRFVAGHAPSFSSGERWLDTAWHVDLTGAGKEAFVGWLEEHARPEHLAGWGRLLDALAERLPPRRR